MTVAFFDQRLNEPVPFGVLAEAPNEVFGACVEGIGRDLALPDYAAEVVDTAFDNVFSDLGASFFSGEATLQGTFEKLFGTWSSVNIYHVEDIMVKQSERIGDVAKRLAPEIEQACKLAFNRLCVTVDCRFSERPFEIARPPLRSKASDVICPEPMVPTESIPAAPRTLV